MLTDNGITLSLHGVNDTLIWGMSNAVRTERLAAKLNVTKPCIIWVNIAYAFDPQWMRYISEHPGVVLTIDGTPVLAHARTETELATLGNLDIPVEMTAMEYRDGPQIHNHELRKLDTPFVSLLDSRTVKTVERASYFGAYKGVTDILTKYLWPELALILTRIAAKIGLTPNMVTSIGAVGCVTATILFYYGHYWAGCAIGFIFMVLDTVDGKLARCTITSSWWGNIFDHGIDLVHPPFWYWAWAVGLSFWGQAYNSQTWWWVLGIVWGGYVLQRLVEGEFIRRYGIHIHVWQKFDSDFRLITARRNPNMVLLVASLLFMRPDLGLIAVAIWTGLSCLIHIIRLFQAMALQARGKRIESWFLGAG
ncbi:CDP-alcohol phosphatidyltransferase family protein [Parasphingorhabdus sp. JC815]|uniref:CDP-alcohol phosphatidyltransferase family protein n=1 Tax=Parasphingorhabdus sp. JC815 TaxID=3232140 RepID=UPI00345938AC